MRMEITEALIKRLEAKGFQRWTKGTHDRLYASPENFGLELRYYKSGHISGATLNGEKISNGYANEIKLNTSAYINLDSGKLYIQDRSNSEIVANVKAAIAEAQAEAAQEANETGDTQTETAATETEAEVTTNLTGTERQVAAARKIIAEQIEFVDWEIAKDLKYISKCEARGTEDSLARAEKKRKKIQIKKDALAWLLENATSAAWWMNHHYKFNQRYDGPSGFDGWEELVRVYTSNPEMKDFAFTPRWIFGMK